MASPTSVLSIASDYEPRALLIDLLRSFEIHQSMEAHRRSMKLRHSSLVE